MQVFIKLFNFSFFSITGWGIDLDCCDIESSNVTGIQKSNALTQSIRIFWASLVAQLVKNSPAVQETLV